MVIRLLIEEYYQSEVTACQASGLKIGIFDQE